MLVRIVSLRISDQPNEVDHQTEEFWKVFNHIEKFRYLWPEITSELAIVLARTSEISSTTCSIESAFDDSVTYSMIEVERQLVLFWWQ